MAVKEGEVLGYREGTSLQDSFDGLQLDHIPSKQAIKEAYVNVQKGTDSVEDINEGTRLNIDKETTTLARANESHAQSDTTGPRNKLLAVVDSNVLALASVRDLEKYERIELDRVDYTWSNHGVNIVLSYETGIFYNIFLYPNGSISEFEYINNKKPCTLICKENDFDQNFTMQEVRDKYGEPDVENKGYPKHKLLYRNINDVKISFMFTNVNELYFIMLGWRD